MKITILCENTASEKLWDCSAAEWGFSAFIEKNGTKIIFDFGGSDVFLKNATALKINLQNVNFLALSHHHFDHVGGLRFWKFKTRQKFVAHPEILKKIPRETAEKLEKDFEFLPAKTPFEFAPDCFFLGEIPRITNFEKGIYENDEMRDDSALAFKTARGAVVVAGCSHAGICNICEFAKKVTGQKLRAVVGGFHLFENDAAAVDGTIKYFANEKVEILAPMHCVEFSVLAKMHQKFSFKKYCAGDEILISEK